MNAMMWTGLALGVLWAVAWTLGARFDGAVSILVVSVATLLVLGLRRRALRPRPGVRGIAAAARRAHRPGAGPGTPPAAGARGGRDDGE